MLEQRGTCGNFLAPAAATQVASSLARTLGTWHGGCWLSAQATRVDVEPSHIANSRGVRPPRASRFLRSTYLHDRFLCAALFRQQQWPTTMPPKKPATAVPPRTVAACHPAQKSLLRMGQILEFNLIHPREHGGGPPTRNLGACMLSHPSTPLFRMYISRATVVKGSVFSECTPFCGAPPHAPLGA